MRLLVRLRLPMHRFLKPVLLRNRPKNGTVSAAGAPVSGPFSFPRISRFSKARQRTPRTVDSPGLLPGDTLAVEAESGEPRLLVEAAIGREQFVARPLFFI